MLICSSAMAVHCQVLTNCSVYTHFSITHKNQNLENSKLQTGNYKLLRLCGGAAKIHRDLYLLKVLYFTVGRFVAVYVFL